MEHTLPQNLDLEVDKFLYSKSALDITSYAKEQIRLNIERSICLHIVNAFAKYELLSVTQKIGVLSFKMPIIVNSDSVEKIITLEICEDMKKYGWVIEDKAKTDMAGTQHYKLFSIDFDKLRATKEMTQNNLRVIA